MYHTFFLNYRDCFARHSLFKMSYFHQQTRVSPGGKLNHPDSLEIAKDQSKMKPGCTAYKTSITYV